MGLNTKQQKAVSLIVQANADDNLNYAEIADKVGISPRTLRTWRKDPEFQEALDQHADEIIDSTTFKKAVQGDVRAIKEWNRLHNRGKDEGADPLEAVRDATATDLRKIEKDVVESLDTEVLVSVLKSRSDVETALLGDGEG